MFVGPYAVIRADEVDESGDMEPIVIGANSNIQDGVVIHSKSGALSPSASSAPSPTAASSTALRSGKPGLHRLQQRAVQLPHRRRVRGAPQLRGRWLRYSPASIPSTTRINQQSDLAQIPRVTVDATEFSGMWLHTNIDLVKGYKALSNEF